MRASKDARMTKDGDFDCEVELALHLPALVEKAVDAGWTEEEVANALLSYAQNLIAKLNDDAVIDATPPTCQTLQ